MPRHTTPLSISETSPFCFVSIDLDPFARLECARVLILERDSDALTVAPRTTRSHTLVDEIPSIELLLFSITGERLTILLSKK